MQPELLPRGVIFTATGPEKYFGLAARAATSLRQHNPDLPIDLYTDKPRDAPAFDKVHILGDSWSRSRIDAMLVSRFERTLMLDSDILVLANIEDIFEVLERFDVAAAHDQSRNGALSFTFWRKPLPSTFAQFNGGVIAYRKSDRVQKFLRDWSAAVKDHAIGRDQPSLRELLWDSDLRIATLPEEYNLMKFSMMREWTELHPAPRILHSPNFHGEFERYMQADDPVVERIGLRLGSLIPYMMRADIDLAKKDGREPFQITNKERIMRTFWIMRRLPRRLYKGTLRVINRDIRKK